MKRIFCVILAVCMLAIPLAACNGDEAPTITEGELAMATNADFPPFEFINEAGEYDGFDVELARAIADILDKELVVLNMAFEAILPAIQTGQAHVGIAAMTITEERAESVNFTIPYFETSLVVIVTEDSAYTAPGDLTVDTRIVVQQGTTSDLSVTSNDDLGEPIRLQRPPDTVLELTTGRADAIVIDEEVANQFILDNPDLRIFPGIIDSDTYGMAVALDNTELLELINDALQQLKASNEYQTIFDRWFGGEENGA